MKENWTQGQLVATLLVTLSAHGVQVLQSCIKVYFETGNARFLEDVEFGGKEILEMLLLMRIL